VRNGDKSKNKEKNTEEGNGNDEGNNVTSEDRKRIDEGNDYNSVSVIEINLIEKYSSASNDISIDE